MPYDRLAPSALVCWGCHGGAPQTMWHKQKGTVVRGVCSVETSRGYCLPWLPPAPPYSMSCLLCRRRHCSSIRRGRGWVTAGSIATQSQRACEAPKKMQGLFCKWEGKGDWEKRVSFSGTLLISLCKHWRMTCFCWVPRVAIQFPFIKLDSWYLMNETCHKTLAVPRNGSSWQR